MKEDKTRRYVRLPLLIKDTIFVIEMITLMLSIQNFTKIHLQQTFFWLNDKTLASRLFPRPQKWFYSSTNLNFLSTNLGIKVINPYCQTVRIQIRSDIAFQTLLYVCNLNRKASTRISLLSIQNKYYPLTMKTRFKML